MNEEIVYLGRYRCITTKNGCHECVSHKCKTDGRYYSVKYNGCSLLLHRLIYEKLVTKIPDGLVVRHKCDNVLCINPQHLIHGTHIENVNDAVERDRMKSGEQNKFSKLTESEVVEIIASNDSKWALAERYGVHERTIRNIKAKRNWKRV